MYENKVMEQSSLTLDRQRWLTAYAFAPAAAIVVFCSIGL